jgi:deoxyribodipyrimidine photolyase
VLRVFDDAFSAAPTNVYPAQVACFLTRGDLYQSWEAGARVFDKYLIDADWALNNANWMWLSCSSFFYQYFRCVGTSLLLLQLLL